MYGVGRRGREKGENERVKKQTIVKGISTFKELEYTNFSILIHLIKTIISSYSMLWTVPGTWASTVDRTDPVTLGFMRHGFFLTVTSS